MTTAPPEVEPVIAEDPAVVGGESHGELTCVADCGPSPGLVVEALPIVALLGVIIGLAIAALTLVRRRLSRRSRKA